MSKAGRNEPCPCGSGKKYKKCCLQEDFVHIGREESINKKLVQKLLELVRRRISYEELEDVAIEFWGDFEPEKHLRGDELRNADNNFWEWIIHDRVDEDRGKSLVDMYVEDSRAISLDEKNVLNMMKNSVLSLYEVQEVFPEKGLLLTDLLLGGEYDVREKAATRSIGKWDIFAARLLHLDGQYTLSGAAYPFPLKLKEDILGEIWYGFEEYGKRNPEGSFDGFLKENGGHYFNSYWCDLIENPPKIHLSTTDGEKMVISRAYYEVKDRDAVISSLRDLEDFDEHEDGNFTWLARRNKDGQATVLGNVRFDGNRMVLEGNSRERLKKGKAIIKRHIKDVAYTVDSFEDIEQALKDYKGAPSDKPDEDIPFEVQQQMCNRFMGDHCRKWLREKIPALGGRTPKQAVRSRKGTKQVRELLKLFENHEEHNKREGVPYYDLSWMWEELGIKRED